MRKITAAMFVLGSILYADYSMVYEMHDPEAPGDVTTATFKYKDAEHSRLDMKMRGDAEMTSMLVRGKKAYMITYENGRPNVMDMDEFMKMVSAFGGGMPEESEEETEKMRERVQWHKTGKQKTVGGIKGEVWEATVDEEEGSKTYKIVMSDDRSYVKAVRAYEGMMKRMAEGGGGMDTGMFTMIKPGYAPLEIDEGQMRLQSFSEKSVSGDVFELPKGASVQKSPFGGAPASGAKAGTGGGIVEACYTQLCCGQTQGESEVLSKMLSSSAEGYRLEGSAKCDPMGLGSMLGVDSIEGAIYKRKGESVTVTMELDAKNEGAILTAKKGEGGPVTATDYKTGFIGEYRYHYALLQPMNVQQLDIVVDKKTLITLSHRAEAGKVPLVKFAKEAIDFDAYKPKPAASTSNDADSEPEGEDDDEAQKTRDAINKGVGDAVDALKSLF